MMISDDSPGVDFVIAPAECREHERLHAWIRLHVRRSFTQYERDVKQLTVAYTHRDNGRTSVQVRVDLGPDEVFVTLRGSDAFTVLRRSIDLARRRTARWLRHPRPLVHPNVGPTYQEALP